MLSCSFQPTPLPTPPYRHARQQQLASPRLHFNKSRPASSGHVAAAAAGLPPPLADADAFTFSCDFSVRDYELDSYSVVNNAIYASYLQHVRHEYLASIGLAAQAVAASGQALALSDLHMRYLRPLRSGDHVRGTCRVVTATAARLVFQQQLWLVPRRRRQHDAAPVEAGAGSGGTENNGDLEELLVLDATATVVSLDAAYRPKRINKQLMSALRTGRPEDGAGF